MKIYLINLADHFDPGKAPDQPSTGEAVLPTARSEERSRNRQRGRALRSEILAHHLDLPVSALGYSYEKGRPRLTSYPEFSFNTSYCGERMALVCANRPVGIDLEALQGDDLNDAVMESLFHPIETARVNGLRNVARVEAFYGIWTQKEAFAKAIGEGASVEFSGFSVPETQGMVNADAAITNGRSWYTQTTKTADNYMLALASDDPIPPIEFQNWPPQKS